MVFRMDCVGNRFLVMLLVALATVAARPAMGVVFQSGDVLPGDNPLTQDNEGILAFLFDNGGPFNPPGTIPDQPTFEHPLPIVVGQTSYGIVLLNGGSQVRYEDLVLGGSAGGRDFEFGDDVPGSPTGHGIFRIEGFGTVYNNNPNIIPPNLQGLVDPTPRPTGSGFDVYVGLTGSGTLQVVDGGRMEIEDALVLGWSVGSYGEVLIDGFSSHIDQAGLGEGASDDAPRSTLIGPLGTGVLTIQNGAQLDSRRGAALGTVSQDGGVGLIRIDPITGVIIPAFDGAEAGGQGIATVEGIGSAWRIAGGLSVGAWFNDFDAYFPASGQGELTIANRAIVTIYEDEEQDELPNLLVGVSGRVNLIGEGRMVVVGDGTNDGTIVGSGRIDMATFRNRRTGELRASAGERLILTSSATSPASTNDGTLPYFFANDGLIEVLGGQIEFLRSSAEVTDGPNPGERFHNRNVPAGETLLPTQGKIVVQNGVARFQSGLLNDGVLAITNGNNVIRGNVENGAPAGGGPTDLGGALVVTGGSTVTFEDGFLNRGIINLGADGSVVHMTVLGDFINDTGGIINFILGGGPTSSELGGIAVAGQTIFGAGSLVAASLSATGVTSLDPQPGDEFTLLRSAGGLTGTIPNFLIQPALSDPSWSWLVEFQNGTDLVLRVTDIIAIGGDFDGNGIVDANDLLVWQANFGITMGANPAQGDANGDGAVNILDYYIWLDQVGGAPVPVPGGLVAGMSAVPEPSTMLLSLVAGIVAAGAMRRRFKG